MRSNLSTWAVFSAALCLSFSYVSTVNAQSISLVQIRIDASFDDSSESVSQLRELLPYLPSREVLLPPGGSISQIIATEYGFGASNLPTTYTVVATEILHRNGDPDPTGLKPGKLLIPLLPKWALSNPNPNNPLNQVPKLEVWHPSHPARRALPGPGEGALLGSLAGGAKGAAIVALAGAGGGSTIQASVRPDLNVAGYSEVLDEGRRAASSVIEELHIPEHLLPNFLKRYSKVASAFDYQMTVRLASSSALSYAPSDQATSSNTHQVFAEDEHKLIRDFLADSTAKNVVLLIADTGWPDEATYKDSRAALLQLFDIVRSKFKLGASPRTPYKKFEEPNNAHCKQIARSLTEFRNLDTHNRITVIYVPLLPEQDAGPLLRELIEIDLLQKQLGLNLGFDSVDHLPGDIRSQAKKEANRIVSKLQPSWSSGDNEVKSDEAVISAYLSLLDLYSQATKRPSFLSESWSLPNKALTVAYPDPLAGLVVAAAGNEKGLDFIASERDFAGRCARHKDTVAVIGLDQAGNPQCDTSVTQNMLHSLLAVGFDGMVATGICGTSFATPRVAWLLAIPETKDNGFVRSSWENLLYQKLTAGRTNSSKLREIWFDTRRFLSGGSQLPP